MHEFEWEMKKGKIQNWDKGTVLVCGRMSPEKASRNPMSQKKNNNNNCRKKKLEVLFGKSCFELLESNFFSFMLYLPVSVNKNSIFFLEIRNGNESALFIIIFLLWHGNQYGHVTSSILSRVTDEITEFVFYFLFFKLDGCLLKKETIG